MREFLDHFSELFDCPVVAAGGCVRDTLIRAEPKDYDLFLLGKTWEDWDQYREKLLSQLEVYPEIVSKIEWHKSEPFLIKTFEYRGKEIQILATPCKTIEELLATFDWGVCCFGYDGTNYTYDKGDLPVVGGHLRLNKVTFPFSTLRRGYRFSERYLMRIKREDLNTICKLILES